MNVVVLYNLQALHGSVGTADLSLGSNCYRLWNEKTDYYFIAKSVHLELCERGGESTIEVGEMN